jgi:hypothetical protein
MLYYTIFIPIIGIPYKNECSQHFKISSNALSTLKNYEMSGACIDLIDECEIGVIVSSTFSDMMNYKPAFAQIYAEDEDNRDKLCGFDEESANRILAKLLNRKWYLWNRPPKE